MHGGGGHKTGYNSIGKSRHKARFESESGNAHQQSCQHSRTGSISTNSDHNFRPELREDAAAGENGTRDVAQSSQASSKADTFQLPNLYQAQVEPCLRNEPSLDSAV